MSKWLISSYLGLALAVAISFNSCSEVEFNSPNSTKSSEFNPLGENDDINDDPNDDLLDDADGVLKTFEEDFVVKDVTNKVDIFLVIDNSGSMKQENEKLGNRLTGFVEYLDSEQVSWQMCYTTTDVGQNQGNALYWRKKQDRGTSSTNIKVLKSTEPNRAVYFTATVSDMGDNGSGNEQGITAIDGAISSNGSRDCFRDDAVLSVILISDEDQKSCGGRCKEHPGSIYRGAEHYQRQYREILNSDQPAYLMQRLASRFPQKAVSINSIVIKPDDNSCYQNQDYYNPAFFGEMYSQLSAMTGGLVGNICAENYTEQLNIIAKETVEVMKSISLQCAPIDEPQITVEPNIPNLQIEFDGNKAYFSPALSIGTKVNVKYTCRVPK